MVLGTERAKALALRDKLAVYLIFKQGDHFSELNLLQFIPSTPPSSAHR